MIEGYKKASINERFEWVMFDDDFKPYYLIGIRLEDKSFFEPIGDGERWIKKEKCLIYENGIEKEYIMQIGLLLTSEGNIVELPLILNK